MPRDQLTEDPDPHRHEHGGAADDESLAELHDPGSPSG
jgi:hypothetical protein